MVTPIRVVFDSNVFSPESFDLLDHSPMRKLCKSGRIIPFYGHVLLEETFRAYGGANKRNDLVTRWIPFITETLDRFCDDLNGIFHKELVQGHGLKTNIYMRKLDQERLLRKLPNIPLDGSWRAWHASKLEREAEDKKRAAQRETSKEIRKEVADWRKRVIYNPKRHGVSRLAEFFEREVENAGAQFLPAIVKCKNPRAIVARWSKAKMEYPYFTTFVIGMLYIAHYAMTRPNDNIDLNAQADLNLMMHLLHADVLVSNETGFLHKAFQDLWRPKGKVLFSSREFSEFMHYL